MSRIVLVGVLALAAWAYTQVSNRFNPSEVSGQDYDPLRSELDYSAPDGFNAGGRIGMNDDVDDGSEGFTGL